MTDTNGAEITKEDATDPVMGCLRQIEAALSGRTREEACRIMCAVSAMQGFYGEAIRFAEMAAKHKLSIVSSELGLPNPR